MQDQTRSFSVYLDQNVYSRLLAGEKLQGAVEVVLDKLQDEGAIFVYSQPHIEEIQAAESWDAFVDVIEALPAYFLEPQQTQDPNPVVKSGLIRDQVYAEQDLATQGASLLYSLLLPIQFSQEWLGTINDQDLQAEMVEAIKDFRRTLEEEIPSEYRSQIDVGIYQMLLSVHKMPLQHLKSVGEAAYSQLRERLPANYAQLDAIPSEQVAEYVLNCLDPEVRDALTSEFPKGFWSSPDGRQFGGLTGFCFFLFMAGVTRERKVKSKGLSQRKHYYRGQFRDCQHIEIAAQCDVFCTFDKGAARLAKASYAWAGVKTQVIQLVDARNEK